ncbi:MAG: alanine racemase [Holophagales bacterium]|jgi:alanine racemase|nr:alanine racemase [Holophagales bacterium]
MAIFDPTIDSSDTIRATWAEVNLGALRCNFRLIKEKINNARPVGIMLMVKANAYGHGLVEVARTLSDLADCIGVAVLEEGILLRREGIKKPIVVMGGVWGDQIPHFIKHDLILSASSMDRLFQIDDAARAMGRRAKVHLKIDTGMERVGIHYFNAHKLQEAVLKCANVDALGIYSHFANADAEDLTHAKLQLERFQEVLAFYEKNSIQRPIAHMANSAAMLRLPESHFDLVRPGLLLYGVYPSPFVPGDIDVSPAMTWKSRVVYFKVVPPGHPVSYGSTWESDHPARMVTVPVGYGDGYFRSMSNISQVIINNRKYPQVGTICMDQLMVNIEWDSAYNGDEVILLGSSESERITVEDMAAWANTVPYEVFTAINARVPRVYSGLTYCS